MNTARSAAACIALALGAHAGLLMPRAPGDGGHAAAPGASMHVRVQVEAGVLPPAAEPDRRPVEAAASTALAQSLPPPVPEPRASTDDVEAPPQFDGGPPDIGFPDAALPEAGAEVRAYVLLDAEGRPQAITTAAPPGLPAGFRKLAESALRQARFQAGSAPAYCLLVRFTPGAPAADLSWLPGAARDASRCLSGPRPAPRGIVAGPP